jgi:hypothetical protein
MATINNVKISVNGQQVATAAAGEIAPPPAANLTVDNPNWLVPAGKPAGVAFLQKRCQVTATAVGQPFQANYTISSIVGDGKIKLTAG